MFRNNKRKSTMQFGFFTVFMLNAALIGAQSGLLAAGTTNTTTNTIAAPASVQASDGVYDKFVLIRWEAADKGNQYRLFRATSASGASLKEMTQDWQKSTWFCDYSAEKGKDYYYAVMASDGRSASAISRFDKGFLRKDEKVAQDESLSSAIPDRYAAGKQLFALVSEVSADTSVFSAGSTVALQIGVQNIFDEPTPQTDLRVYLSKDAAWNFDDTLLASKSFSGFPANARAALTEPVPLPAELLPGEYYLLVVAAPEGNIQNAKTGVMPITISNR